MKILIVDDNKLILESMSHNLKSSGYEILLADDGFKALKLLEHIKIDLIISDVMMPSISGLDLLNLLKQFYFSKTPLILMSTLNKADLILQSLALGATDYLVKPVDFTVLKMLIRKNTEKQFYE